METRDLDITFPTLPSTISRVQEFIGSGKTDPGPLIEIIEQDPSVSVNVLRRANSAFYGVRKEVDSIERAVRLLGYVEISSLVLIDGVRKFQEEFREHKSILRRVAHTAAFTGRFGQEFIDRLKVPDDWTRVAFSAGFVCAMARLLLLRTAPDRYEGLVEFADSPLPAAEAEKRAFGASYRTFAPAASSEWELPEQITEVLRIVAGQEKQAESPERTLAVAIRGGSDIARRDLADETLVPEVGLDEMDSRGLRNLVKVAARKASTYAEEVGHF